MSMQALTWILPFRAFLSKKDGLNSLTAHTFHYRFHQETILPSTVFRFLSAMRETGTQSILLATVSMSSAIFKSRFNSHR